MNEYIEKTVDKRAMRPDECAATVSIMWGGGERQQRAPGGARGRGNGNVQTGKYALP